MARRRGSGGGEGGLDERIDELAAALSQVPDPVERSLLVCRAVHGLIGGALDDPFAMLGVLEVVRGDLGRDLFAGDHGDEDALPGVDSDLDDDDDDDVHAMENPALPPPRENPFEEPPKDSRRRFRQ